MGYKPDTGKVVRITYDDFPGLEVYATAPPMGELMDIADMKLNVNAPEVQRMKAFEVFSAYVKTWNVEHPTPRVTKQIEDQTMHDGVSAVCARCELAEDAPVPNTAKHMMCLPITFIMPVFFGWLTTVSRVDPTKYLSSNGGERNIQEDLMRQLAQLQSPMPSSVPNLS